MKTFMGPFQKCAEREYLKEDICKNHVYGKRPRKRPVYGKRPFFLYETGPRTLELQTQELVRLLVGNFSTTATVILRRFKDSSAVDQRERSRVRDRGVI